MMESLQQHATDASPEMSRIDCQAVDINDIAASAVPEQPSQSTYVHDAKNRESQPRDVPSSLDQGRHFVEADQVSLNSIGSLLKNSDLRRLLGITVIEDDDGRHDAECARAAGS